MCCRNKVLPMSPAVQEGLQNDGAIRFGGVDRTVKRAKPDGSVAQRCEEGDEAVHIDLLRSPAFEWRAQTSCAVILHEGGRC